MGAVVNSYTTITMLATLGFIGGAFIGEIVPHEDNSIAIRLTATREVCANTRAIAVAEMFRIQQSLVDNTVSKFDAIAAGNEINLRVIEVNKFYGCNL
jgi:hypothetical protein